MNAANSPQLRDSGIPYRAHDVTILRYSPADSVQQQLRVLRGAPDVKVARFDQFQPEVSLQTSPGLLRGYSRAWISGGLSRGGCLEIECVFTGTVTETGCIHATTGTETGKRK
ncbi:hypothetical protein Bbelb_047390 [Branchiostoma belcheri]|nr:hypothetical protein Bbelb_047390 [Branchiostoma belcheri]